ncbi:MAG: ATP-binding protein [Desulfovibrionaceae bacterium]
MRTMFASPDRSGPREITALHEALSAEALASWLDALPMPLMVLDGRRQIVFSNAAFRALADRGRPEEVLGQRPGEALDCVNARVEAAGCGCSVFCRNCGAVRAILTGLAGQEDWQECRLVRRAGGTEISLDLQVFARPVVFLERRLVLFSLRDVSHERRRAYLERLFFHDMADAAGGVVGLGRLLDQGADAGALAPLFRSTARGLMRRLLEQHHVLAAEQGRLAPEMETFPLEDLLESLAAEVTGRGAAGPEAAGPEAAGAEAAGPEAAGAEAAGAEAACRIRLDSCAARMVTDRRLLEQVLRCALANAVEAAREAAQAPDGPAPEVVMACRASGSGRTVITIRNPGEVPASVRPQLFRRGVSTRGPDRGIGLYVIRLLGEGVLGGMARLESADGHTTFTLRL